jgi:sec-independent protein translocase protein TatA
MTFVNEEGGINDMLEGLFQPMHLVVIIAIALLVVGPKKLPELGAGIGKSIREFKKAMSDMNKTAIDNDHDINKEQTKVNPAADLKQEMKKDSQDVS